MKNINGLASDPDTVAVVVQQPEITIAKEANPTSAGVGETITYTYTLTNTGDVVLSQVNPIDDQLGPLFAEPISLTIGQIISQTLIYMVVEADLPGPLTNMVTASGTPPVGSSVTATAALSLPLTSSPGLEVTVMAVPSLARPGDRITYSLSLTNSGDVTLHNLSSTVTVAGGFTLPDSLAPGTPLTVTYSYQVMAADLPGPLTNIVTITATPTANEPMMVTTAVATPLEPYVIYLPFAGAMLD